MHMNYDQYQDLMGKDRFSEADRLILTTQMDELLHLAQRFNQIATAPLMIQKIGNFVGDTTDRTKIKITWDHLSLINKSADLENRVKELTTLIQKNSR